MISIYVILICLTIMGAFGGFFFKKAVMSNQSIISILDRPWLYIGGILYVISALLNIYVLKYLPYTVVLPMTSLTYIWTMMIAYKFLDEKIGLSKLIGVFLIILGAILISVFN